MELTAEDTGGVWVLNVRGRTTVGIRSCASLLDRLFTCGLDSAEQVTEALLACNIMF